MVIADVNGIHADGNEFSTLPGEPAGKALLDINPKTPRFIGPALAGNYHYFAMHRPRTREEFSASYRRAFRN